MSEKKIFHINGYIGLILTIFLIIIGGWLLSIQKIIPVLLGIILILIAGICGSSFTIISPNIAKVLTFFGKYVGTIRTSGLFMTIPLTNKITISLRVRNFNSNLLKVNDLRGNPVEIGAVIVFKVVDTAQAVFNVDNYKQFIEIQSESAIRHLASEFPYDSLDEKNNTLTLRGNPGEISDKLTEELQARLKIAGIKIIETRLTHLAYATEIAGAMLQRQQAGAILSARKIIVQGAVSITEDAINKLIKDINLEVSNERKLQLINNIMVTIISERGSQPVINTNSTK